MASRFGLEPPEKGLCRGQARHLQDAGRGDGPLPATAVFRSAATWTVAGAVGSRAHPCSHSVCSNPYSSGGSVSSDFRFSRSRRSCGRPARCFRRRAPAPGVSVRLSKEIKRKRGLALHYHATLVSLRVLDVSCFRDGFNRPAAGAGHWQSRRLTRPCRRARPSTASRPRSRPPRRTRPSGPPKSPG